MPLKAIYFAQIYITKVRKRRNVKKEMVSVTMFLNSDRKVNGRLKYHGCSVDRPLLNFRYIGPEAATTTQG